MLANLGFESEQQHLPRARGRRHAPRDDTLGHPPTYMTAPFAVQQEPTRNAQQQQQKQQQQQYSGIANENGNGDMIMNGNNYGAYPTQDDYHQYQMDQQQYEQEKNTPQYSGFANQNGNGDMIMNGNNYGAYPTQDDYHQYQLDNKQYEQEKNTPQYSGFANQNGNGDMIMNGNNYGAYPTQDDYHQYQLDNKQYEQQQYQQQQPPPQQQQQQTPHQSLRQERLSRGGLNIFSWNTDMPSAPAPRMTRERNTEELLRLRPTDAAVQRDREVREKFEGNTHSRFLCFSEDAPRGAGAVVQHGRRRSAPHPDGGIAGFAGMGLGNGDRVARRE